MTRISIDWACEIIDKALFAPHLEKIFGTPSADTNWKWATFYIPEELGGGWVPCAWSQVEKVLTELDTWLDEKFSEEKVRQVFRAMNPGLAEDELEHLIAVGYEILARADYHRLEPKGTFSIQKNMEEQPRMMPRPLGFER